MALAESENDKYAIVISNLTIPDNRSRYLGRKYAVENIDINIPRVGRAMIFGVQGAGKSTLFEALRDHKAYTDEINIKAPLRHLDLRLREEWKMAVKEAVKRDEFIISDEPCAEAYSFLLSLRNSMLVFEGQNAPKILLRKFNPIFYLRKGRIVFSGTAQEFAQWVRLNNPEELRDVLSNRNLTELEEDRGEFE